MRRAVTVLWVRRFVTIEDPYDALHAFKDIYNRIWIVERHGYRTPAAVRAAYSRRSGRGMNPQRGVSQL